MHAGSRHPLALQASPCRTLSCSALYCTVLYCTVLHSWAALCCAASPSCVLSCPAESTPAERESKALLDEALALAGGTAPPTYAERRPELYASPATTATPASSPAAAPPTTSAPTAPTTATTSSSSSYVDRGEGPYEVSRGMVPDTLALDPSIASGSDAPSASGDLLARGEKKAEALLGEAREAVGEAVPANPLAAVVDKVKGVAEYVR